MGFSELMFTNLSGSVTPIDTRDVDLTGFGIARCASFPCTTTGGFQDRSPAVFTSTYTIAPAAVPEPGYGLLVSTLLMAFIFGRRFYTVSSRSGETCSRRTCPAPR